MQRSFKTRLEKLLEDDATSVQQAGIRENDGMTSVYALYQQALARMGGNK